AIAVTAGGTIVAQNVSSANDNISLTATTGDIEVGAVKAGAGSSELVLTAADSISSLGNVHLQGGNATLTATTGGIALGNTQLDSVTATSAAGTTLTEQDAVTLTSVTAGNGAIAITAGGTITAQNVTSSTDNGSNAISLTTSSGDIQVGAVKAGTDANSLILTAADSITSLENVHLQGDNAALAAGGGIALGNTQLNTLDAQASGGDITIVEQDGIQLARVENTASQGQFDLTADGQVSVLSGSTGVSTNNGAVEITSRNAGIYFDSTLKTTGGDVTLVALGTVEQTNEGKILTSGGDFLALTDGAYRQQDGATTNTGTGTLTIETQGDIVLANLTSANNTGDAVRLVSANGAITGEGTADLDIVADASQAVVSLSAKNGIGSESSGALETQISNLAAEVTGSGNTNLDNTTGLRVLTSTTADGAQHIAVTGELRVDKLLVDTASGPVAHDAAVLAREGNVLLGAVVSTSGDVYVTAEESILSQATGSSVSAPGVISFTAKNGGVGGENGGGFTAGIDGTLDLAANGDVHINQTLAGSNLTVETISTAGALTLTSSGDILAGHLSASAGETLVAGGSLIDVGTIGNGGTTGSLAHPMDTQHLDYLVTRDVSFDPTQGASEAPASVTLHVLGDDGRINVETIYVRDLVAAFADHSTVNNVHVESPSKALEVQLAGPNPGERMTDANWTFNNANEINFTTYWAQYGRIISDSNTLKFADAWTQHSDISSPTSHIVADSLSRTVQGADVQIYSVNERFVLNIIGRETFTDAYYINYSDQQIAQGHYNGENSLILEGRKENMQRIREEERALELPYIDGVPVDAEDGSLIRWEDIVYQLQPISMNE
ncbi:MAG: DUF4097 domain-containing protein, partial [Puniceicoccales bacterium]|nr:DUF4097 domain-containing protein [Puniceicoccales bacterium]